MQDQGPNATDKDILIEYYLTTLPLALRNKIEENILSQEITNPDVRSLHNIMEMAKSLIRIVPKMSQQQRVSRALSVERKATWHETVKNATERFTAIKCFTVAAAERVMHLENIQNPGQKCRRRQSRVQRSRSGGGTSASNWTNTATSGNSSRP